MQERTDEWDAGAGPGTQESVGEWGGSGRDRDRARHGSAGYGTEKPFTMVGCVLVYKELYRGGGGGAGGRRYI